MSNWLIEPIVPDADLDAVLEVDRASFINGWTRQMYLQEIGNSEVSRIYVLRTTAERVAAFCSCWLIFGELHVNNIAVRPTCRNLGLGTALLEHVLDEAAAQGARRATLETRRSNQVALRLYERLGFRMAGTRKAYYHDPEEDALILWWDAPSK